MAACWIKFPIAVCVITHEHDRVYSRVCDQIDKYASAVNMIDPGNKLVGLMTVLDVIDEIIGDSLYQFIEYCMAKCEKVISLQAQSKRYLFRRYQVKLFRFISLYSCHPLDLQVDLRGAKQVIVYTSWPHRELVYFIANEHKHKPLTMKDVRSKLEGRIVFHYLFVDS